MTMDYLQEYMLYDVGVVGKAVRWEVAGRDYQ